MKTLILTLALGLPALAHAKPVYLNCGAFDAIVDSQVVTICSPYSGINSYRGYMTSPPLRDQKKGSLALTYRGIVFYRDNGQIAEYGCVLIGPSRSKNATPAIYGVRHCR